MAWYSWFNRKSSSTAADRLRAQIDRARLDYEERHTSEEKIKVGPAGLLQTQFLPWFSEQTGETGAMRAWYRKMMGDPVIKSSVVTKVLKVAALDLRVIPHRKNNARDQMVAEFVTYTISKRLAGGVPGMVWNILVGATIDGYSVNEKVWGVESKGEWKHKWVLRHLKPKIIDDEVSLKVDEYNNVVGVEGQGYGEGEVYHPRNFVIYSHLPLYGQPSGMSDMRAAYSRFWIMDTAWKLRAMALEKKATPPIVGTYTGSNNRLNMQQALEKLKYTNWIAVPESARIEAIDIAGRSEDIFANAIRDLREEIVLSIEGALLQALSGAVGSQRGASAVHKDTADLRGWFLSASLASLLNDREAGLIPDIVDRNFMDAPYPWASFGGIDDRELLESMSVDMQLHQMLDLSQEDMYERTGRRPPKNDADRIPSVQRQQAEMQQGYQLQQQDMAQPSQLTDEEYLRQVQAAKGTPQFGERRDLVKRALGLLERKKRREMRSLSA